MDKRIEVIGIDHGWSKIKTVNDVFTTGVKEISTEPAFYDNVVQHNGTYYKVGGKRLEVRDTKVENDNFYHLTLAAVAKELNRRGMRNANVLLSVGLPLTRFGAEKQDFIKYLSREKTVGFQFEKEKYNMNIVRVSVFPQCYAAVVDRIRLLPERTVIVDIGSWTIDIMPVQNGSPNEAECITIPQGLIRCMRDINEECVRQLGQEIDENLIQQIMIGETPTMPDKYIKIVHDCIGSFVEKVYNTLKEHGYNLDLTHIVFVGGGATVMKIFGSLQGSNIRYIEDIRANAKGYEHLGRMYLESNRKKLETEVM